ncbi:AsmA-like C-terminal region-containing protein [bacterium]|nr:AsmA-like C-terminal region-containing protein [bacterium]
MIVCAVVGQNGAMVKKRHKPPLRPESGLHATAMRLRRIKRRWKMLRFGVRALVVFLLLIAGGLLFILFYPLSIPWLDKKFKERWAETVGLPLDYQRSTIRVALADVTIDNPVLKDPETGDRLLYLRRVRVNASLLQLLFGRGPRVIDSLELEGPTVVRVITKDEHLELMAPWPRVINILQERLKRSQLGAKPPLAALRQLTVAPVDLRWIERSERDSHVRMSVNGMALTVDFEQNTRPRQVMLSGRLADGPGPGREFLLTVRPDLAARMADVQLRLEAFGSRDLRSVRVPVPFSTGMIRVSASVERGKDGAWRSQGGSQVDNVLILEEKTRVIDYARMVWAGKFDPAGRRVQIDRLVVSTPLSSIGLAGWAGTQSPWPYDLRAQRFTAGMGDVELIADHVLPGYGMELIPTGLEKIEVSGRAAGESILLAPDVIELNGQAWGIDVASAKLPLPVRAISGRVQMTTGTLRVERLACRYGGLPIEIDGVATGTLPRSVEGLRVNWKTGGTAKPDGPIVAGPTFTGDLNGSGTLTLAEPTREGIVASLARAEINGGLRFRDVTLRDARLPAPVTGINGRIDLAPNEARAGRIEGRMGSTALSLSGSMAGKRLLWSSPTLTVDARIGGELPAIADQVMELAAATGRPIEPLPPVAGSGMFEIQMKNAPLADWRSRPVQASVNLKDFATTLALARVEGPLVIHGDFEGRGTIKKNGTRPDVTAQLSVNKGSMRGGKLPQVSGVGGRIGWSNGTLRFEKLAGETLGGRVTIDGTLSGKPEPWVNPRADLKIEAATSLANALAQAHRYGANPRRFGFSDFGGNAVARVSVAGPLADWRKLETGGRIDVDDFSTSFTIARVNGPLRFKRLGLELKGDELRIEPASGKFGGVDVSAEGVLKPGGGLVNLKLDGELPEMQRRSPPGLELFTVAGAATIEHHQKIEPRPGFKAPTSWPALADYFTGLHDEAHMVPQLVADWRWDFDGIIRMRDGEMTFWRMPTPLKGITGMVYYNQGRLWSPEPLAVTPIGSRNVKSSLEITWTMPPNPEGTLNFGVTGEHFDLTPWLGQWNARRPKNLPELVPPADKPYNPNLKPSFSIRGTFKTRTGSCKGIECGDIDGILTVDDFRGLPAMVRWYLSQASVYGGKADLSGSVYSRRLEASFETRDVELRPLSEALSKKQKPGGIFSGVVTGRLEVKKDFRVKDQVNGQGQVTIKQSRLVSNAILHSLGGLLKLPLLEDISFSTVHGPVTIENNRVHSTAMVFDNPIINLKLSGSVGFDKTLDLQIAAQVFQIVEGVPLLGTAVEVINQLVGKVIRAQVKGTTENPEIKPL